MRNNTPIRNAYFYDKNGLAKFGLTENTPISALPEEDRDKYPELYLDHYPALKYCVENPVEDLKKYFNNFVNHLNSPESEGRLTFTDEITDPIVNAKTIHPKHFGDDKKYVVIEAFEGDYENYNMMSALATDDIRAKGQKNKFMSVEEYYLSSKNKRLILHVLIKLCEKDGADYSKLPVYKRKHYIREAVFNIYGKFFECTTHRPIIPAMIYRLFGARKVYDTSAGWGDRMLAAMASGIDYTGVDPNVLLQDGHKFLIDTINPQQRARVITACAEMFNLADEVDGMYSSPPFFTLECYSMDKTQSINYRGYKNWLYKFLFKMLKKCIQCVKNDGFIAINIINWRDYNILDDMITHMTNVEKQKFHGFVWYRGGREGLQVSPIATFKVVK